MITVKKPMPGVSSNDVCLTSTADGKYHLLQINSKTYMGDTEISYDMELVSTKIYGVKKFYVEDGIITIIFDEKPNFMDSKEPVQLNG